MKSYPASGAAPSPTGNVSFSNTSTPSLNGWAGQCGWGATSANNAMMHITVTCIK